MIGFIQDRVFGRNVISSSDIHCCLWSCDRRGGSCIVEVTAYAFGFGAVFFGAFVICFRLEGARFPFTVRYNWATERVSIRMLMRTVESDDGCFPMLWVGWL